MITKHENLKRFLQQRNDLDSCRNEWAQIHQPLISPSTFSIKGRNLNHFCIGSDPEFVLKHRNQKVDAINAGLKVGLAAGCDQNERLVELRPYPSTSVIKHTAGILSALRWMYRVYQKNLDGLEFRAGAFFQGDGIGGHIHFGRKRPTRADEVEALDGLAEIFRYSGLFDFAEWQNRMAGDRLNQRYGLPGDYRLQRHGYEYRSLPSWLSSPTTAFISIASSKLAVLDPEVTRGWAKVKKFNASPKDLLRGLAKLYKGRDDDAYCLYHVLTCKGDLPFETAMAEDFRSNWGIPQGVSLGYEDDCRLILPACIKPSASEISEMESHLLFGAPLIYSKPKAEFTAELPSKHHTWLPTVVSTNRRSGFGDLIHNLVTHTQFPMIFEYDNSPVGSFRIEGFLSRVIKKEEVSLLKKYRPSFRILSNPNFERKTKITVPRDLCQTATIAGLRAVLVNSGIFPIWTVEDITGRSGTEWAVQHPIIKKEGYWRAA